MTPMVRGWLPSDITKDWDTNPDIRLDPDSIANVSFLTYALRSNHDSCEWQSYFYLVSQDRSAWTWELDCAYCHLGISG